MGHPLLQIPFLARRPDRMSQRGLDRDNRSMLAFVLTVNCLPSRTVKPTKLRSHEGRDTALEKKSDNFESYREREITGPRGHWLSAHNHCKVYIFGLEKWFRSTCCSCRKPAFGWYPAHRVRGSQACNSSWEGVWIRWPILSRLPWHLYMYTHKHTQVHT